MINTLIGKVFMHLLSEIVFPFFFNYDFTKVPTMHRVYLIKYNLVNEDKPCFVMIEF